MVFLENAKDVTKFMSSKDTPTASDSATLVEPKFQFGLNGVELQHSQVKCGTCKTQTPHQWLMIPVSQTFHILSSEPPMDQLELNEMAKRLVLCQNCGNMRLIK